MLFKDKELSKISVIFSPITSKAQELLLLFSPTMLAAKGLLYLSLLAILHGTFALQFSCPKKLDAEVLVLGAGIAGLGAAEELSKRGIDDFIIIEARDKIGGRIQSAQFGGGVVELGPKWILSADLDPSDRRQPLLEYVDRCNIQVRPVPFGFFGLVHYNRTGHNITAEVGQLLARYGSALAPDVVRRVLSALPEDEDLSLSQGLRAGGWIPRTILEEHAEHFSSDFAFAFPAGQLSYRDNSGPDINQLRATAFANTPVFLVVTDYPNGFFAIAKCVADGYLKESDPRLILNTVVTEIQYGDECVCVETKRRQRYCGHRAIVTFSAGVLQSRLITFTPPLPPLKNVTINQLEMGHFLKVYVSFEETFWDTNVDFITYADELRGSDYYPIFIPWGAFFPDRTNVLLAFISGLDESTRIVLQDPEITRREIGQVMRNIYGSRAREPTEIIVADYIANPYFYGNIFASSVGVGPRQFDEMNSPEGNLYFSGDAIDLLLHSTVHGALLHGRRTAGRIADITQGPLKVDFINDTPRVEGHRIIAEFSTSKEADRIICFLSYRKKFVDCSSGRFVISGIPDGRYFFKVIAGVGKERAFIYRSLTVSTRSRVCGAHLLGNVMVTEARAAVKFASSGFGVTQLKCSLDNYPAKSCVSPLILNGLAPGPHKLSISPVCDGKMSGTVASFTIKERDLSP